MLQNLRRQQDGLHEGSPPVRRVAHHVQASLYNNNNITTETCLAEADLSTSASDAAHDSLCESLSEFQPEHKRTEVFCRSSGVRSFV